MMAEAAYVPNPMWWIQLRLLGGWRRVLTVAGGYLLALAAAAIGFRRLPLEQTLTQYCDYALVFLAVLQVALIIFGGCNAVHRALVRDLNSRMIESHRISPMSGPQIALGYVFGPTFQVLLLYVIGAMFGALLLRWGSLGIPEWLLGNAYMLVVAIMAWSGTVLLGLLGSKPISPLSVLFIMFFGSPAFLIVPGLGIFGGMYAGAIGVVIMTSGPPAATGAIVFLGFMAAGMAVLWLFAAMRKYRRPDRPAIDTVGAVALLMLWCTVNAVAVWKVDALTQGWAPRQFGEDRSIVFLASLIATLVVAMIPVSAAAESRCRIARGGRVEGLSDRTGYLITPLWCAATIAGFVAFAAVVDVFTVKSIGRLVGGLLAILAAVVATEGLAVVRRARNKPFARTAVVFIFAFWAVPYVTDLVYRNYRMELDGFYDAPSHSATFAVFSPVGTLETLVNDNQINIWPGLGFQLAVAAFLSYWGYRSIRRLRSRRKAIEAEST